MDRKTAALRVQSSALESVQRSFAARGFTQLLPVVLSTTTDPLGPDPGSSVIATPAIEYLGQQLVLTQSMILHKQMAVASGLERLYIVSPNVRLENPARAASGRHLFEFSQVDFEMAHGTMDDVFALTEQVIAKAIADVKAKCADELKLWGRDLKVPSTPFKRYTTHELAERYGDDWEPAASREASEPFWALCHKREFYDREDPTQPGHYRNYDLIYPEGFGEALSGAEREWDFDRLTSRISKDRLAKGDYASYLERAKQGLVPTAGAGFGVERLTRFLVGAHHVGDIQLFRRVPGERVIA